MGGVQLLQGSTGDSPAPVPTRSKSCRNGDVDALYLNLEKDNFGHSAKFVSIRHRDPLLCSVGAVAELVEVAMVDVTGKEEQAPLLFHAPGNVTTPLDCVLVESDLEKAFEALGVVCRMRNREDSAWGLISRHCQETLLQSCSTEQLGDAWGRIQGCTLPEWSASQSIWQQTTGKLKKILIEDAAFKLKAYGGDWPLSSLKTWADPKVEHVLNKQYRRCVPICAFCFQEELPARPLSKCSRCRVQQYCSRACQRADYKLHKLQCVRFGAAHESTSNVAIPMRAAQLKAISKLLMNDAQMSNSLGLTALKCAQLRFVLLCCCTVAGDITIPEVLGLKFASISQPRMGSTSVGQTVQLSVHRDGQNMCFEAFPGLDRYHCIFFAFGCLLTLRYSDQKDDELGSALDTDPNQWYLLHACDRPTQPLDVTEVEHNLTQVMQMAGVHVSDSANTNDILSATLHARLAQPNTPWTKQRHIRRDLYWLAKSYSKTKRKCESNSKRHN